MAAHPDVAYFPSPFVDETIYSVCARFNRAVGYSAAATSDLLRAPGAHAHSAVPRALDHLEQISGGLLPASEQTLRERTLLRAYIPLIPVDRRRALLAVCREAGPVARALSRAGLNRYASSARLLRYCSTCADQERRHESPYWHASLQLPGTWFCPKHRCLLRHVIEAGKRNGWWLPAASEDRNVCVISVPDAESQMKLWRLQQVMTWIASQSSLHPSTMQVWLRARLHRSGYCRSELKWLQVEMDHLAGLARSHYCNLNVPDITAVNTGAGWFDLLFRERRHYDPLTWALGLAWVGSTDAESLSAEYAEAAARKPAPDLFDPLSRKPRRVTAPAFLYAAFDQAERKAEAVDASALCESEVNYWLRRDPDLKIHWETRRRDRRRRAGVEQISGYLQNNPLAKRVHVLRNCATAYRWLEANDRQVLECLLPQPVAHLATQLSLDF